MNADLYIFLLLPGFENLLNLLYILYEKKHKARLYFMEENEEKAVSEAEQFRNRVILKAARIEKVEQHPGGSLL